MGLPAGDYTVEVRGNGFQLIKDAVTAAGKNLQRDFELKLGTLQETINVRINANAAGNTAGQEARDVPTVSAEVPMPARKECVASTDGGRIVPPKKIRDARPYYPSALRGTNTDGVVQLEARIGADGYIADVSPVGDAQPDLAQSAVAAVREWRYTETLLNCTPVEVKMMVTINFSQSSRLRRRAVVQHICAACAMFAHRARRHRALAHFFIGKTAHRHAAPAARAWQSDCTIRARMSASSHAPATLSEFRVEKSRAERR